MDRQRIDKWLWHARMVRTRSDAAALTEAGYVRLNGTRVTAPSQPVRVGDVVTLALDRSVRVVRVEGFCERRGDAPAARGALPRSDKSSGAKAVPERQFCRQGVGLGAACGLYSVTIGSAAESEFRSRE